MNTRLVAGILTAALVLAAFVLGWFGRGWLTKPEPVPAKAPEAEIKAEAKLPPSNPANKQKAKASGKEKDEIETIVARGELLPKERQYVYPPVTGFVKDFAVKPGDIVRKDQFLVKMFDLDLAMKIETLEKEIEVADVEIQALNNQLGAGNPRDNVKIAGEIAQKTIVRKAKQWDLQNLRERTDSDTTPGEFWLKAPLSGKILSSDFQETFVNRLVKPSEPLLRVGYDTGQWEIELKIPQKCVGQVLRALEQGKGSLDVDIRLRSWPEKLLMGKLSRDSLAGEVALPPDAPAGSLPILKAWVRLDGDDIPDAERIPREERKSGIEARCTFRHPTTGKPLTVPKADFPADDESD